MDPDIEKKLGGVQHDRNYQEFLSWMTDGGLRYAFAKYNRLPDAQTLYRSTVPMGKVKDVIVVGAGMAGLSAAYELAQIGHKVTILEARDRVGGRVHTYRGFDDELHGELGAMRIPQLHFLVSHYVSLFGLRTEVFAKPNLNTYMHMHGKLFRKSEWQLNNRKFCDDLWPGWDANLPNDHDVNGIIDLAKRTFGQVTGGLTRESSEQEHKEWVRKWSRWTLNMFLRSDCYQDNLQEKLRPWPEAAIKAYKESIYTNVLDIEVCFILRFMTEQWFYYPMYGIYDGMDMLPKAFLNKNEAGWNKSVKLHDNIVCNSVLERLEMINRLQGHKGVKMICRNKITGETSVYEADAAIITVPLPVLRNIDLPLSEAKRQALGGIKAFQSTKILLQCRSRFWEKDIGDGGTTITTLPIGQLQYCKSNKLDASGSQRGLLMVYTLHDDALTFGEMEEEQAIKEAVEQISQIHPEIKTEFEVGKVQAWHKESYSQCAVTALGTNFVDCLETLMAPAPDQPLYLAGEGLSRSNGWVQGAIFSGLMQAYCLQSNFEDGSLVNPVSMMT